VYWVFNGLCFGIWHMYISYFTMIISLYYLLSLSTYPH
jgi:hypothetical protein